MTQISESFAFRECFNVEVPRASDAAMLYVPSYMSAAGGRSPSSEELHAPTSGHRSTHNTDYKHQKHQINSESLQSMDPQDRLTYLQQQTQSSMYHRNLKYIQQQNTHKGQVKTAGVEEPSPPLVMQNLGASVSSDAVDTPLLNGPLPYPLEGNNTPWILRRSVRFHRQNRKESAVENHTLLFESSLSGLKDRVCSSNESLTSSIIPARITTSPPPPSMDNQVEEFMLKRSSSRRLVSRKRNQTSLRRVASLRFLSKNALEPKAEDEFSINSRLSFRPEMGPNESTYCSANQRVTLNVSGMRFETWSDILSQHPKTLLGNPEKRKKYYDSARKEFFFDRHRLTFEAIFNYYQYGGKLKRPHYVPDDIFLEELRFFEIEPEIVGIYRKAEGYIDDRIMLPEGNFKQKLWKLFEMPETSKLAFFVAVLSVLFTVISIILFCLETLPKNKDSHCVGEKKPNFNDPYFITESICTAWFTLEVIVRWLSCPSKIGYLKDLRNYVDIAAIVPYYVTLGNVLVTNSCDIAKSSASLSFLRAIRLVRVFKLTKHSAGLQILILTFRASLEGLGLFLVALIVCILLFSSTIYYAECNQPCTKIASIPDAFWWAVITMCTVGYGDIVPVGTLGKLIGSVCAVAGVLTLAIPVPIITENFNKFYAHKSGRQRI
ncbi:hypothetical protein Ciccas_007429 [Cichlidogyrus casuarinus]|uniref:BTB domain-containing protein n=1 Tax=Cichlidogyrus casuarinus TaxID=1844966 RepID=A0ABD2Q3M4_9PLAT